jgi:hypothetical protein
MSLSWIRYRAMLVVAVRSASSALIKHANPSLGWNAALSLLVKARLRQQQAVGNERRRA